MAQQKRRETGGSGRSRVRLEDLAPEADRPKIAVTALDRAGEEIHVSLVGDDGSFDLPAEVLEKAHRIRLGPADSEETLSEEVALTYRPRDFQELMKAGSIDVARVVWDKWFVFIRCASGTVKVCRRSPWWFLDLAQFATKPLRELRLSASPSLNPPRLTGGDDPAGMRAETLVRADIAAARISPAASLDELLLWPFRCAPVCKGTVEVYRRTCCCDPWVFEDPRLPGLLEELEEIVRGVPDIDPIPDPRPGPDPAPWVRDVFFKDGTLDEMAVRASHDLQVLRSLPVLEIPTYLNARPYLICRRYSCSTPVKVGHGTLGPDGRFNVCWRDTRRILNPPCHRPRCHDEYAYVVKQSRGPFTITIYNGLAANRWFHLGDDPTLITHHPRAYGCRDNGGLGEAFVFLDLIGDTGAHELKTPGATGPDRVATPVYNDGLVFPAASPASALGAGKNRNWGGRLKLSYMFSESMKSVGAKYYRVSVLEADANGDPVGPPEPLSAGLSWNKSVFVPPAGVNIVPVVLGPFTVGTQDALYEIPYDSDADWNDGQYHAYLNTDDPRWSDPTKRHLVMLEVFDSAGQRLRPTGTPATGLGGTESTAAFTYRRRFQNTGPTANVPFGAVTHMFWWDNRDVFADVLDLRKDGLIFNWECLFFSGSAGSTFSVGYRAYHPEELFQLRHRIWWKRGLGSAPGNSGYLLPSSSVNVGMPPLLPGASPTNTFAQMLRTDLDPTRTKCAFTVFLRIWNKRTDGDWLGYSSRTDSAAFVIEIN